MGIARQVFLSYARKDASSAAHSLRDALKAAGFDVWLDTDKIPGGVSWSKEVEDALNACDALVALLTPASFISEICRSEQIWVLDKHKLVIPVLAGADDTVVPIYLKSRNYRKLPEQQAELLKDLGGVAAAAAPAPPPAARPRRYNTVPNLPQNFVVREQALIDLKNLVFSEDAGSHIAVTALQGMGGIGKTVLAAALCREPAVQCAFPDGIAWIVAGREWGGDFVPRMREVGRALGEDVEHGWDTKEACANKYKTILEDKAALVVIDDVWSVEQLEPLLVEAPRSRFLFTTRDGTIASAVTTRKFSASLLNHVEGREMLAKSARVAVSALPPQADEMVDECGGLALAISQIGGALIGKPGEWSATLMALKTADIRKIELRLTTGQKSFFKSLAVSFDALADEMKERYLKLAVLLEDVPASLVVLRTLWKADEDTARLTGWYFVDRSLATWENEAEPERGIKLHDLQLDYVRARFEDQKALGLIRGAWRLSEHVVTSHPEEFVSQMVGRLLPYGGMAAVKEFTKGIEEGATTAWLKPLWPTLDPPGTALIRTFEGHSLWVRGVAITPDGKRMVSASGDKTLKVWELETGRLLLTLAGHSETVESVAVTPDGKKAVSASQDRTLKIWDLESGSSLSTLGGHSWYVNSVAITADGKFAVSASSDRTLKIWDLERAALHATLEGHDGPVASVALTPDGKLAVSASEDKTLRVWDLATGSVRRIMSGHSNAVSSVAVTADGKRAVSASADKTIKIWDIESGIALQTSIRTPNVINGVAVTPDGKRIVSASRDKTLTVWDLETGSELRTLSGHANWVWGVAVTPDGKRVVSASWDNTLKLWELDAEGEARKPAGHSELVFGVAVAKDGRRGVSASDDHTLKVWDLETGGVVRTLKGHTSYVRGVAIGEGGKRAISGSWDKTLRIWDLETGNTLLTLEGHSAPVSGVSITADGKSAVSASDDKTLRVWNLETGETLRTLEGHSDAVRGLSVTPDGTRAVSGCRDTTLKVWDLAAGTALRTLTGHAGSVTSVAQAMDGKLAASASHDKTLKIWDLETGLVLRTLTGHALIVECVAITPDGLYVISASPDKTIRVWNFQTGRPIATFHCEAATRCCACAGGKLIFAGDDGGRLYLLSLEIPT